MLIDIRCKECLGRRRRHGAVTLYEHAYTTVRLQIVHMLHYTMFLSLPSWPVPSYSENSENNCRCYRGTICTPNQASNYQASSILMQPRRQMVLSTRPCLLTRLCQTPSLSNSKQYEQLDHTRNISSSPSFHLSIAGLTYCFLYHFIAILQVFRKRSTFVPLCSSWP